MGDLTTIDKVKLYIGQGADVDNKDDVLLQRCLDAAEEIIEGYCGRTFQHGTYTEYYDGTDSEKLVLRQHPITLPPVSGAVTPTVLEYGTSLSVDEDAAAEPDVLIIKETGTLIMNGGVWVCAPRYYKITYSAGFPTIPKGIEQAAIDLTCLIVRERTSIGIASKTTGQQTVALIRSLPEFSQRALDMYRDFAAVVGQ